MKKYPQQISTQCLLSYLDMKRKKSKQHNCKEYKFNVYCPSGINAERQYSNGSCGYYSVIGNCKYEALQHFIRLGCINFIEFPVMSVAKTAEYLLSRYIK